ncbi:hypothetical protein TrLO_g15981 [Triparma laevis f. longispina]|uniref:Uncharacterized protein n=1 Tax=Triparma laevis f. longispina TaxID=1714387 RepID=A0A9W7FAV7_9STRA|nr:hypothetical protein TrLO_g15981 [Triparma laevis f. longispina]
MTMATIKHHTSEIPDPSLSKIGRRKSSGAGRNKAPPPSPGVSRGVVKGGIDDGEVIGADSTRDLNNSIEDSQQVDNFIVGEDEFNQSSASIPQRRIMEVVKSAGLVFSEKGEHQFILSKPKIMAIKSREMEKLEAKLDEDVED